MEVINLEQRLTIPYEELSELCQNWNIIELALFGSILRQDFNPNSDIDLLVSFDESAKITFFELDIIETQLSQLFNRPVDLVTKRAIESSPNWIRRKIFLEMLKSFMNRDDEIILDLVRAIRLILEFTEQLDFNGFSKDIKTQSSVLYQIIIIGESVNKLTPEFVKNHPEIPINAIRGMRNRVVHQYKEIDLVILWEVIQTSIPELLNLIEPLIRAEQ